LTTVQDFDEILVLRDGRIVERGKHAELMQQRGHYAELFALQLRPEVTVAPG
jgi:ABC-type multidrug transport system fused ATPase/permease subunit